MTHRRLKAGYFVLAALNTLATSIFLNFLFFYFHDRFGFGNRENLAVTAAYGFIYTFAAWGCGKFAARCGLRLSLKLGFAGLALIMAAGALADGLALQLAVLAVYSVVLLLTWPALEALVSERETQAGVQEMVGVYNSTWAAAAALAYFTGGKLYDEFGKGAVYWLPAGIFVAQFALVCWLDRRHDAVLAATPEPPREVPHGPERSALNQPVPPAAFLKMAWLANPFAYIAINTLIAVMPVVTEKFKLTHTEAGLFCSVWFFARFGAFVLLWKWRGWHYRFRWLLGSFAVLIASLATILISSQLWLVVLAQVLTGLAVGLIYYSSLFYSMDVGEASSEHGGLHEAFIGAGICVGPAAGAAALTLAPQSANVFAWAVSGLLVAGCGGLVWLRLASHKRGS